jgi:hypothetical protein
MTAKILPTMRMEELFAVEALQSILYRDMSRETRPMTQYEETPSRIAGLFDGIAYSKSNFNILYEDNFADLICI